MNNVSGDRKKRLSGAATMHVRKLIRVLAIAAAVSGGSGARSVAPGVDGDGYRQIFNGRDLAGWQGDPRIWSVRDGAITGETTEQESIAENTFLVWQDGEPENFELRASFRLVANNNQHFANSGIYYRSRFDAANRQVFGYQGDMDAALPDYLGALYEDERGTIAKSGQKVRVMPGNGKARIVVLGRTAEPKELATRFAELTAGHWLNYTIIVQGKRLRHYVNEVLTADVIDEDSTKPKAGVLALQVHHGQAMVVQFNNIRLKVLP